MKTAKLYQKLDKDKVKCQACAFECVIAPKKTGICGVRQNKNGQLYLLTDSKPIAVNIDPIEKKPLFHFLPNSKVFSLGTIGCNFACQFCQNWDISQYPKQKNQKKINWQNLGQNWPPKKIVNYCLKNKIQSIAYTYNEPTVFIEYAYDVAKLAHQQNIKNIFVSNGYGTKSAYQYIAPYLDAINIDLKSFDNNFYLQLCQAQLEPVLKNIRFLAKLDVWLEITTLIIPSHNDSNKELKQIAQFIAKINANIPWHISAFFPTYKMTNIQPTPEKTIKKAYQIGQQAGLNFVYTGNFLDSDSQSTFCPKCGKKLIKRIGYTIEQNKIKNNQCPFCSYQIPGIWKK